MKTTTFLLTAAATAGIASMATAASELQLDVNALIVSVDNSGMADLDSAVARGSSGFSTTYTGSITMNDGPLSDLAGILCDGVPFAVTGSLNDFTGSIDFVNGQVAGGSFTVEVVETGGEINTYSAQIASGIGAINTQAGQGFQIDGLTFAGMFSSGTFAGVDVSRWFEAQPLPGSFLTFQFEPNADGVDTDTDIDIFVVVPLPAGGAIASVALIGLAGVRRRRLA